MDNRPLYDFKLDGALAVGDILTIFTDGERVLSKENPVKEESPQVLSEALPVANGWSNNGYIQYLEGFAYGISPSGETLMLGMAGRVKQAIGNPNLKCHIAEIDNIISMERGVKIKEVSHGERSITTNLPARKLGKPNPKRIRLVPNARGIRLNTIRTKKR